MLDYNEKLTGNGTMEETVADIVNKATEVKRTEDVDIEKLLRATKTLDYLSFNDPSSDFIIKARDKMADTLFGLIQDYPKAFSYSDIDRFMMLLLSTNRNLNIYSVDKEDIEYHNYIFKRFLVGIHQ